MTNRISLLALTLLLALAPAAFASTAVDKAIIEKLRKALDQPAMGLTIETVKNSEIPGLLEVQFNNGPVVYSSPDGSYFIVGDMFTVTDNKYVNLAEQRRDVERAEKIAAVDIGDMIVFPAEGTTRAHITVFTDISCFYCQKLHKEVPELNRRGVEVRYLAYPRNGVDSPAYRQLATAWCASNPQEALTKLKNKQSVPDNVCKDNPVAAEYVLGQEVGVQGTPAMITESGKMIPGYQSADQLMVTLGLL